MRPRIGLDARFALGERRGIGNYSLELFRAMAALNREFEFVFYSDRKDENGLLEDLPNCTIRVLRPGFYPWWEQVLLPLALHRDGIDLFHAVGNTAPIIVPRRTKLVITICDVMYMKSADHLPVSTSWYQRLGRWYRRIMVPLAARQANHLLTISEFSKTDIIETIPDIQATSITVTLLGPPGAFTQLPSTSPTDHPLGGASYLLHLGGVDPRKNTLRVIRACLDLRRSGRLKAKLAILGLRNLDHLALTTEERKEAEEGVYLPGFVPESELPKFYRHAAAFLFPSLYEGFGIPLLEAMTSGTPIITSNNSSLPEVAGNAALLVDPARIEEIQSAILQVLDSPDLVRDLRIEGYRQIKRYSWLQSAQSTLAIFRQLLIPHLG